MYRKGLDEHGERFSVDKYTAKGSQALVWRKPTYSEGIVHFKAQSDAVLVKGIIAVVCCAYSGSSPDQIIETSPDFKRYRNNRAFIYEQD